MLQPGKRSKCSASRKKRDQCSIASKQASYLIQHSSLIHNTCTVQQWLNEICFVPDHVIHNQKCSILLETKSGFQRLVFWATLSISKVLHTHISNEAAHHTYGSDCKNSHRVSPTPTTLTVKEENIECVDATSETLLAHANHWTLWFLTL